MIHSNICLSLIVAAALVGCSNAVSKDDAGDSDTGTGSLVDRAGDDGEVEVEGPLFGEVRMEGLLYGEVDVKGALYGEVEAGEILQPHSAAVSAVYINNSYNSYITAMGEILARH